ncbi:hypothetical protein CDL15_Pgr005599 [Punica granatum]|uniref:Uncharacterized protein n=1 Tax=Punica granatum TaxID=22663 RepID=A0A218WHC1_PUNGR|nr:hypothetical protein CDL15_Pgr005599 [Punica granatum]
MHNIFTNTSYSEIRFSSVASSAKRMGGLPDPHGRHSQLQKEGLIEFEALSRI